MTTRFAIGLFLLFAILVAVDFQQEWGLSLDLARWLTRTIHWLAFWR